MQKRLMYAVLIALVFAMTTGCTGEDTATLEPAQDEPALAFYITDTTEDNDTQPPELEEPDWEREREMFLAQAARCAPVWRVQPTLEYESIFRCSLCGFFTVRGDWSVLIDTQTGQRGEHDCPTTTTVTMIRFIPPLAYDPQRGLFGHPGDGSRRPWIMSDVFDMHPLDELMMSDDDRWGLFLRSGGFFVVESVDSSKRDTFANGEYFLTPDAHSGEFALMHNGEFVTGFMFNEIISLSVEVFAVRMGDNWGAIDRNGDLILPFEFECFRPIDNHAAFAKYDGAYGILDLRLTLESLQS